jgi:hypothetical protein
MAGKIVIGSGPRGLHEQGTSGKGPGWDQPGIPGGSLSDGRPGRMDGGFGLGPGLLDYRLGSAEARPDRAGCRTELMGVSGQVVSEVRGIPIDV